MIIVVCTDDPNLVAIAQQATVANPQVFGRNYLVFAQQIPHLGANEDLFILAHGVARGDDRNPVIGDEQDALFLNAVQLFQNIEAILPDDYGGRIYISACEVLNPGVNSLSFAEMFVAVVQDRYPQVRVFGHRDAQGALPPPGDGAWVQAAGTHRSAGDAAKGAAVARMAGARGLATIDSTGARGSADEKNGDMMKKIYSKLSNVVSVGSSVQSPGNSFLVLASPGIFVDPDLDLHKADDAYLWASVLNRIPLPNFIYSDSGESLDSLYDVILQGKELPLIELTPEQKRKLDEAMAVLEDEQGEPTRAYEKYFEYQNEYYDALVAFQEAKANAENEGTPIPPGVQSKLKQAKQKWDTLGRRQKIETAISVITNLSDLDPNTWWANLRERFDNFQTRAPAGTFGQTGTFPKYERIFEDKGWTTYSFNQEDYANQEVNKSVSAGGGLSAKWGLWRASAEASYSKDEGFRSSTSTNVEVSVELMRVQITRPWLEPLVFRSRAWRFSQGSPISEMVSDGIDATTGATPTGLMPLFPTTAIIARNLVISAQFSQEDEKWMNEQIKSKASFGWGPFSVSGNYNQSKSARSSSGQKAGNKLSNPDPQIIGWMCSVLPQCPNPDESLPWPGQISAAAAPRLLDRLREIREMEVAMAMAQVL